jgi:hypothetical protein
MAAPEAVDSPVAESGLSVRDYRFDERPDNDSHDSHTFGIGSEDDAQGRTTVTILAAAGVNYPGRLDLKVYARGIGTDTPTINADVYVGGADVTSNREALEAIALGMAQVLRGVNTIAEANGGRAAI